MSPGAWGRQWGAPGGGPGELPAGGTAALQRCARPGPCGWRWMGPPGHTVSSWKDGGPGKGLIFQEGLTKACDCRTTGFRIQRRNALTQSPAALSSANSSASRSLRTCEGGRMAPLSGSLWGPGAGRGPCMNVVTAFPFLSPGDSWVGRQVLAPLCSELSFKVDTPLALLVPSPHLPC